MEKIIDFLGSFFAEDYFIIFVAIMFIIFVVLIIALIKAKKDYNELGSSDLMFNVKPVGDSEDDILDLVKFSESIDIKPIVNESTSDLSLESELLEEFEKTEVKKPTIDLSTIMIPEVKTYDNVIDEYELSEEENAVISTSELEKKTRERMDALGLNENETIIQKYEEEQEKKAIISYEQLLKNASNITIEYKEEERVSNDAPVVNKIEVLEREVIPAQNYIEDEEFLKILKEFRAVLE